CFSALRMLFFLIIPPPPSSTLFPYTTLFRSFNQIGSVIGTDNAASLQKMLVQDAGQKSSGIFTTISAAVMLVLGAAGVFTQLQEDRKSTRLNSSHSQISYAVFCLKKKTKQLTIVEWHPANCSLHDFNVTESSQIPFTPQTAFTLSIATVHEGSLT